MTDVSLPALLARVIVSLAVVLAVMAAAAAVLRRSGVVGAGVRPTGARRNNGRRRPGSDLEVLARTGLGRSAALAVVRLGGRGFVLGVTESQISLLAEIDVEIEEPQAPGTASEGPGTPSPAQPWTALLEALRERTVRRR